MTKQHSLKKSIRAYAAEHGVSYTAARRLHGSALVGPSRHAENDAVFATYEFYGADAPAPLRIDIVAFLERMDRREIDRIRASMWHPEPDGAPVDEPLDFLAFADMAGQPEAGEALYWVRRNTVAHESSYIAPDPWADDRQRERFEQHFDVPCRFRVDLAVLEEWIAEHR